MVVVVCLLHLQDLGALQSVELQLGFMRDSSCKMQAEEDLLWLSSQIQPATACDCIELMSCSAFKYLLGQVSWGYAFSWSIPFVGAL